MTVYNGNWSKEIFEGFKLLLVGVEDIDKDDKMETLCTFWRN
jgi:hypothetical protein